MANIFDRTLQASLPLPLARLYVRAFHAKGARERHDHAFHLVETSLKLATAALVARYRRCGRRTETVDAALRHIAMPSLGQWRDIFRDTLQFLGTRPDGDPWSRGIFERLSAPLGSSLLEGAFDAMAKATDFRGRTPAKLSVLDLIELLPAYRNAMSDAHGSIKADPSWYELGTTALLDCARAFMSQADALGGGHLVYAEEVRFTRPGDIEIVWMEMTGPSAIRRQAPDSRPAASPPGQSDQDVLPGKLYLEIAPGDQLCLHPFLYYQCGEIVDQVFFLNRARGGRSGIQFLCYATGEFYLPGRDPDGDELVRDLQDLLAWITSAEIAPARAALDATLQADATAPGEAPEAAPKTEGRTFGDFEIIAELGRGGMGIVYLARQLSLERLVALKVLPFALRTDHVAVARFKQEIRALARCDHPNVVKVLSSGQAEGTYYYAMEYIDGTDIASIIHRLKEFASSGTRVLREGHFKAAAITPARPVAKDHSDGLPHADKVAPVPISLDRGREINFSLASLMRDAARGVQHIHDHGIIHRDIKPQNIMVTRETLQPVVMDLGLAKITGTSASLTVDKGTIVGTLRYMAPEQLQRNLLEVDARADVYALGAVLYELVCGRCLFDGDTEERLSRQILFEKPRSPRAVNARVPTDLATVIEKATRKDPRERYASAAELSDDLDRFATGKAIAARPPSLAYFTRLFVRRHAAALAAGVTAIVLFLAVFMGLRWHRIETEFSSALRGGTYAWERYHSLEDETVRVRREWSAAELKHETWEPVWERRDEIEAWHRVVDTQNRVENAYNDALLLFHRARTVEGLSSAKVLQAQEAIAVAYWERWQEAERQGTVAYGPDFFRGLLDALQVEIFREQLSGGGTIELATDPPGADVYLFRYSSVEERLVPLPFAPSRLPNGDLSRQEDKAVAQGFVSQPYLEIERILNPSPGGVAGPFKERDRLLRVRGQDVRTCGDLAATLKETAADAEVDIAVMREGTTVNLRWVPFPAGLYPARPDHMDKVELAPGRFIDAPFQFGFAFAAYPLQFADACRIGMTQPGAFLRLSLPRGSYLVVFRKAGHSDTRYPIAMPFHRDAEETVRLPQLADVPKGFVYIPAGRFTFGGDHLASQSLPFGEERVREFAMSRFEVTISEYLEFLNDPALREHIDSATGVGPAHADWQPLRERRIVAPRKEDGATDTLRLIPFISRSPGKEWLFSFDKAAGTWQIAESYRDGYGSAQFPLFGASMLMAYEYAHWLTKKCGGIWRFRLPTDMEWERAARGADRRIFVWGDYAVWSFCNCPAGTRERAVLKPQEWYPIDESVFGVRNLAGAVCEPTAERTTGRYRYIAQRGGNWYTTENQYFRTANRNGILPEEQSIEMGIRLVAELPAVTPR